jgi:hypothetical protein
MRRRCLGDGAYRPVGRNPFSRGMRQDCAEPNDPDTLIDRGGLHGGDLMLAQRLAHNVEPTRERHITEGPFGSASLFSPDGANERFFRVDKLGLCCIGLADCP